MEEKKENTITRLGTLGGKIRINQKNRWMYFGDKGSNLTKEKLFGITGPLHFGVPSEKAEMAVTSVQSDTSQDLTKELMEKGLTREEAVKTIQELLKVGVLVEVYDPDLKQKVLVFRR